MGAKLTAEVLCMLEVHSPRVQQTQGWVFESEDACHNTQLMTEYLS